MEYMGETFISPMYKKSDYRGLNLNMRSREHDWDTAIDIFKDRIQGRYLNVIDRIIDDHYLMVDGFSIMAINCLLIETLLQFKNGWDETRRGNAHEYSKFLNDEFPNIFPTMPLARKFYSDIRCGILHSAQTKNGSQLTVNKSYVVSYIDNSNCISVDVKGISRIIEEYFLNYIDKLKDSNNEDERYMFMKKMNYMCRI